MVIINSASNANNLALARTLLQPAASEAATIHSKHLPSDGSWLSDLQIGEAVDSVDDFIYDTAGKLSTTGQLNSPNFWEVTHSTEKPTDIVDNDPTPAPWTQSFSSVDDFKTALHSYLRQKVASPGMQLASQSSAVLTPEKQALKDGVVRDSAPKEADDLVRTVAMLNDMIKATHSDRYNENDDYRDSVDTFTSMFKKIITNDYGYLKRETDMSGPLIVANDDGTYSIPDFTISYKGEVVYAHSS